MRASEPPPHLPERIGPYKVLNILGEGGMGRVFLALDEALGRKVAIKVIRDDVAKDSESQARFVREARAMAQIRSPHVVTVYQVGVFEREGKSTPYLVMELLGGDDLDKRIDREGAMLPAVVARFGAEAAAGLLAAAQNKIVHRDVKPANLLLDDSGAQPKIKLTDFGLARPIETESHLTQEGIIVGSPFWLAPERIRGVTATHASDVYSLGATLYQALTGVVPYQRKTPVAVALAHAQDAIPDVDGPLGPLVRQMLAKEPEDRPTLAHVERELRRLQQNLEAAASLPESLPTETMEAVDEVALRASASAVVVQEEPPAQVPDRMTSGGKSVPVVVGAAILAGVLVVGGGLALLVAGVFTSSAPEANTPVVSAAEASALAKLNASTCAERKSGLRELMRVGHTREAIEGLDAAEAKDRQGCFAPTQLDQVRSAIAAKIQAAAR